MAALTLLVFGASPWHWCCCDDPAPCPGPGGADWRCCPSFVLRGLQNRQNYYYYTTNKTRPVPALQWTALEIWVFPDTGALELFCHTQRKVQLPCTQASACWFFRVGQGQRGFAQPPASCWPKDKTTALSIGKSGQKHRAEDRTLPKIRGELHESQKWFRQGNERPSMSKHRADPFHTRSQEVLTAISLSQESFLNHNFTDL